MKKEKKRKACRPARRIRASTAVTWRILAFSLSIWLCAMVLITETAAWDVYHQFEGAAEGFFWYHTSIDDTMPGALNRAIIQNMQTHDLFTDIEIRTPLMEPQTPSFYDSNEVDPGYEMAMIYYDGEMNMVQDYGPHLYFAYQTEETFRGGSEEQDGYAYVDLDETAYGRELAEANLSWYDRWNPFIFLAEYCRLTGYFEGSEFHLMGVAFFREITQTVYNPEGYSYGELDALGRLPWQVDYDETAGADRELVSIYLRNGEATATGNPSSPVTVDGKTFENLKDLLEADKGTQQYAKVSLTESVITRQHELVLDDGNTYRVAVALRCYPLKFTVTRMWKFYLVSFLLVLLVALLILRSIRKNLIAPVNQIARCTNGNPVPLPDPWEPTWREPRELEDNYTAVQQALQESKAKVKQLETALEFARNAEEHRKQMISNITHELKTPLAIIHSYAEGLNAGIAADKQEQYLKVLLEESERMDAMVLEMLDLSRLEAGKVRLSMDRFSLLALTRSIFERLRPVAEEKGLTIRYELAEEFDITADESRIGQVITNFATNAIKYTPEGGNIRVEVYRYQNKTWFAVKNECAPLPEEALEKVWDSFYRVESSRTTKGTGLGLTISKAIIELHGGTCRAANIRDGVEFRFILP